MSELEPGGFVDFVWAGLAVAFSLSFSLLPIVLLALSVPYAVLRLRKDAPADAQFGAKIAFQFFFSASLLTCVAGATVVAVDWAISDPTPRPKAFPFGPAPFEALGTATFSIGQRTGVGMLLAGGVGMLVHFLCLLAVTPANRLRIRRTFIGWRFAVHGAVEMIAVTALFVLVMQEGALKEPNVRALRAVTAVLLVWGFSWAGHLGLLFHLTRRGLPRDDDGEPVRTAPPPPAAPSPIVLQGTTERATLTIYDDAESSASVAIELPKVVDREPQPDEPK